MVKVTPEIKKLADKYCDEHGGPPKPKDSPIIGVDYGGESMNLIWIDECDSITLDKWMKLIGDFGKLEKPAHKTLPPPAKQWLKFNPTPKNPKRKPK